MHPTINIEGKRKMNTIFRDRREAGRQLAKTLFKRGYDGKNTLVLGAPPGGLVVADEVASGLSATLDVVVARKLRAPYQPGVGIGAVVNGDHMTINEDLSRTVGASRDYLNREIAYQKEEIARRLRFYLREHPAPEVSGKTVIVVDDEIAEGYTFRAVLESLRKRPLIRLVAAAPVAAVDSAEMLKAFADEVVCLRTAVSFFAVGYWYRKFNQVTDEEAAEILHLNWSRWRKAA